MGSGGVGLGDSPAVLRRSALAFDDALATVDRKLRSQQAGWIGNEEELSKETEQLEAQLQQMQQTCDALENQEDAATEVRAQRVRLSIYASELKRMRERIRVRAQRRGGGKGTSNARGGGEMEMAVALAGAHRVADELLGGTVDTADALTAQHAQLQSALEESQGISSTLVGITSLLGTVQRSRAKQTLLLALLFALGVCIFLYYSLRRSRNVSG